MLEENRNACKAIADKIPNWESLSKNELCNLYIQNENNSELAEAYFSAIVCKYWKTISKFYSISYNVTDIESVYEWLIDSIIYALKHRSWLKEGSSIYNDPNGPDKVINRCMKCRRFTYYQAINRKKRKDGFGILSLEMLNEQTNSCNDSLRDLNSEECLDTVAINDLVNLYYNSGNYLMAYLIDVLSFADIWCYNKDKEMYLSIKKLNCIMTKLNVEYIKQFSERYAIDFNIAKKHWINSYTTTSASAIVSRVYEYLRKLKDSSYFKAVRE